jgi:hypothetical protein
MFFILLFSKDKFCATVHGGTEFAVPFSTTSESQTNALKKTSPEGPIFSLF